MSLLLLDAMLAPHTLLRCAQQHSPVGVTESDAGWTISAALPGLKASDISLEVDANDNHLWVHALPRIKTELRLPRNAAVSAASASLVNGVLDVKVPRKGSEVLSVTIEKEPLPEDLPEPRGHVSIPMPGIGANDVSATITQDNNLLLTVKGSNVIYGSVHEVLKLPERAVPSEARASMVNGMFSFTIPIAAEQVTPVPVLGTVESEPMDVEINEAAPEGASKVPISPLLLLEAAVPGLSASEMHAEVRGRTLTVVSNKPAAHTRRALRRSVLLPPHARAEEVRASCVNGLLKVSVSRPTPPARTPIIISDTAAMDEQPAVAQ